MANDLAPRSGAWRRRLIALGGALLLGGVVVMWALWRFTELSPGESAAPFQIGVVVFFVAGPTLLIWGLRETERKLLSVLCLLVGVAVLLFSVPLIYGPGDPLGWVLSAAAVGILGLGLGQVR